MNTIAYYCSGICDITLDWNTYICHACRTNEKRDKIPTKTTLVCVPAHISHQWILELKKHIHHQKSDFEYSTKLCTIGRIHGLYYLVYPGVNVIKQHIQSDTRLFIPLFLINRM